MNLRLSIESTRSSGVPVVFVHGFGHHRHVWSHVMQGLDARYRPIGFDLRGHGDSAWSVERHYAIADHASDITRVLDELGIDRAVVVAHSLGGLAAIEFAAAHPERLDALVLVDTGPRLEVAGLDQVARDQTMAPMAFESQKQFADWLSSTMPFTPASSLALLARHALVMRDDGALEVKLDPGLMDPEIDRSTLTKTTADIDAALAHVRCETLVVRGGRSALLSREAAAELAERKLARGRLVTLERAGHAVMLDDPDGLLRAIEDFLADPRVLDARDGRTAA